MNPRKTSGTAFALPGSEALMTPKIRRILVPTDLSDPSQHAVDYAVTLAHRFDAALYLVHAVHDPLAAPAAWELYIPDSPEKRQRRLDEARDRLRRIAASHADGLQVTIEVRFGSPTEEIVAAATAYGIDLIVMDTHGRTGLPHLLLGSIAEQVIRTAPCPVLAVRPRGAPITVDSEAEPAVSVA
jgi:universal stress protein A